MSAGGVSRVCAAGIDAVYLSGHDFYQGGGAEGYGMHFLHVDVDVHIAHSVDLRIEQVYSQGRKTGQGCRQAPLVFIHGISAESSV